MRTDGLFRRTALLAGLALCLGAATVPTQAQSADAYPSHGIELVVPYGAGGGTDALARVFAEAMKKHFSQPITVINKPGASGAIGFGEVAAAKPDGSGVCRLAAGRSACCDTGQGFGADGCW